MLDKFISPFIDFVEKNCSGEQHVFYLVGDIKRYPILPSKNVFHIQNKRQYFLLLIQMLFADKIILHSIFDGRVVKLLAIAPWVLRKCYWVMWGGDLYHYQFRSRGRHEDRYEKIRAFVIRHMGHFVTQIKGDYELVQKWYGAKGAWHECFMYPSNLYTGHAAQPKRGDSVNILVGNSADPTNNHAEVFEIIKKYQDQNIKIYCPLSYGQPDYAKQIAKLGAELFGYKFIPLLDFMPYEEYLELLGQIDIAVFAHKRQQAMGNATTLLGLGKKVYMRSDVTPRRVYSNLGVKVFDLDKLDLQPINSDEATRNSQAVLSYFSEANLTAQLKEIFK